MPADIDTLLSLAREVGASSYPKFGQDHFSYEFTPEQLAVLEQRIRQDEREKNAGMADEWSRPSVIKLAAGEMTASELRTAQAVARGIAAAIRSSGTSQSNPLRGGGNG